MQHLPRHRQSKAGTPAPSAPSYSQQEIGLESAHPNQFSESIASWKAEAENPLRAAQGIFNGVVISLLLIGAVVVIILYV